ncbi:hypothetical protein B0H12DRAFT_171910 [Mycena haematopus]|nr:hypothetical protein B0H12DRAFT_171910 [Mycena haematopus]
MGSVDRRPCRSPFASVHSRCTGFFNSLISADDRSVLFRRHATSQPAPHTSPPKSRPEFSSNLDIHFQVPTRVAERHASYLSDSVLGIRAHRLASVVPVLPPIPTFRFPFSRWLCLGSVYFPRHRLPSPTSPHLPSPFSSFTCTTTALGPSASRSFGFASPPPTVGRTGEVGMGGRACRISRSRTSRYTLCTLPSGRDAVDIP